MNIKHVAIVTSFILSACSPSTDISNNPGIAATDIPQLIASREINSDTGRWYSPVHVARGKNIYQKNCAVCHGEKAAATVNWKQTDANGNYPPPPLNGAAHAWHHGYQTLSKTIKQGGKPLGGVMPAFDTLLTDEEISYVIASFQSYWTDEIYQHWLERQLQLGD